ncbi:MAG TPA: MmcQ/YjbR family DNA-binding protein [Verrucomicrobiae bacterium]
MTANEFRKIALSLPGVVESAHMEHPDFRVGGRIFASLGYPDADWGMVTLAVEEQGRLVGTAPEVFVAAKGSWGRAGSTQVKLKLARREVLGAALKAAYDERVRKNARTGPKVKR